MRTHGIESPAFHIAGLHVNRPAHHCSPLKPHVASENFPTLSQTLSLTHIGLQNRLRKIRMQLQAAIEPVML